MPSFIYPYKRKLAYGSNSKNYILANYDQNSIYCKFIFFKDNFPYRISEKFDNWTSAIAFIKKLNKKQFINEYIIGKCKPYLDIESYVEHTPEERIAFLTELRNNIILVFDQLYHIKLEYTNIKISDSSGYEEDGKYKLSYHVTITTSPQVLFETNIKYEQNSAYHFAYNLSLVSPYIDLGVYTTHREMRIANSFKYTESNRCLLPLDDDFNFVTKCKIADYIITDFDKTNYTLLAALKQILTKTPKPCEFDINSVEDRVLDTVISKFHKSAYIVDSFNNLISFNYYDKKEVCSICTSVHSSNGFYVTVNNNEMALYCRSSKADKPLSLGFVDLEDKLYTTNAININVNYLIDNKGENNADQQIVADTVDDWYKNGIKTLAIKSSMNSGKTTLIKHIIGKYNFGRILWVTFRQTYTNSMSKNFPDFVNYLNVPEGTNLGIIPRLFCQVESLYKLNRSNSLDSYDLIILDEIESVLNQLNSDATLGNDKRPTFDLFYNIIIDNSAKVIAFDADYDNRSHTFVEHLGGHRMIVNHMMNLTRNLKLTNNYSSFKNQIAGNLKDGEKIIVASMQSNILDDLNKDFGDKYKTILHYKNSDDELKHKLKDVNAFWIQYDLILYSPCIEAGIDFNVDGYIDRIYGIVSQGTNSQRSFLQMLGRCRKVKNTDVICYYNSQTIGDKIYRPYYSYDQMLAIHCNMSSSITKQYTRVNGKLVYKNTIDLYEKMVVYGELEDINKRGDCLIPVLQKLCSEKSFGLSIIKEKVMTKVDFNEIIVEKLKAINFFDINIGKSIMNKETGDATQEDKLHIHYFCVARDFGIVKLTREFLDMYYKSRNKINLLSHVFSEANILFDSDKKPALIIRQLVNKLGFDHVLDNKVLTSKVFLANVGLILKDINFSSLITDLRKVLKIRWAKVDGVHPEWYLNSLLNIYGINIKNNRIKVRVKSKLDWSYKYAIEIIDNLHEFLMLKNEENKVHFPEHYIGHILGLSSIKDKFKEELGLNDIIPDTSHLNLVDIDPFELAEGGNPLDEII